MMKLTGEIKFYFLVLIVISIVFLVGMGSISAQEGSEREGTELVKQNSGSQISVTDLSTLSPEDLVKTIVGSGISTSNISFQGANEAAGAFTGGMGPIGFNEGIILSSGSAVNVIGPNVSDSVTTGLGLPGDSDLDNLSTGTTYDATVLEFDFVPTGGVVTFSYVFASDEYNEYVNSSYNDVFAFFINGQNCAVVNGSPVSINTINGGNPLGTSATNPQLFRNNDLDDGGGAIDTEMDGLTVVLTCIAQVNSGEVNHIKLAIADVSDDVLDANVFLQSGSFVPIDTTSVPEPMTMVLLGGGVAAFGAYVNRRRKQQGIG